MTKNMISLTLFYGGLFLMLVCGGMALAGFKKEGSAAFAGWMCHYDSALPADIKALETKSLSYLHYKNWWDTHHHAMNLAAEKYGEGNLPHKLQAKMDAMAEQLYIARTDYLELVHAISLKHENSCGFKALKTALRSLPELERDFSGARKDGVLVTYRIKAAPLNDEGATSFEEQVRQMLKSVQSYNYNGRS